MIEKIIPPGGVGFIPGHYISIPRKNHRSGFLALVFFKHLPCKLSLLLAPPLLSFFQTSLRGDGCFVACGPRDDDDDFPLKDSKIPKIAVRIFPQGCLSHAPLYSSTSALLPLVCRSMDASVRPSAARAVTHRHRRRCCGSEGMVGNFPQMKFSEVSQLCL